MSRSKERRGKDWPSIKDCSGNLRTLRLVDGLRCDIEDWWLQVSAYRTGPILEDSKVCLERLGSPSISLEPTCHNRIRPDHR